MLSTKIFSVLVYIFLININILVFGNVIKYKITYHNKCLKSDSMVRYYLKVSIKRCVWECAIRSVCWSINYRRRHLLCELYSVDDGDFRFNDGNSGPCVFVRKTSFDHEIQPVCTESCLDPGNCDLNSMFCTRRDCRKLALDKGVIIGNLLSVGSVVKIVCNENYAEVEGKTYSTCEPTGEWSYTPRCIATACSTTPLSEFTNLYTNLALDKPVHTSSSYTEHSAGSLVDGNHDATDMVCTHTDPNDHNKYIMVDLGQSYTINALYIINRQDCCGDRLNNVSITIGDSLDTLQLYVHHAPQIGSTCTFVIPQPCRGRYVKIINNIYQVLTLCELEVYGN